MVTISCLFFSILLASACFSMTEAAILSLPFTRARILYEQGHAAAKDLLYVKEELPIAVSSLVIMNNAVNIIGCMFIGELVTRRYGDQLLGWVSAIITFSIIVFGEIIPKTIGERFKIPISLICARPLRWLMFIFAPMLRGIMGVTDSLGRKHNYKRVTEDEIKIMLKLGRDSGTVEVDEEVLCSRVFKLNDVRAEQIMLPLKQAYAILADAPLTSLKDEIFNSPYSRIVVHAGDPSDIVGVVQRTVLLREIAKGKQDLRIRDYMIKPVYVAETTRADTLLSMFQKYHQHLFVVQNSRGVDVGIVTMEDVLEELFGEIYDEKDMETHALRYPRK